MKKCFYLFAIIFFANTLFMAVPAKAATFAITTTNVSDNLLTDIWNFLGLGGNQGSGSGSSSGGSSGSTAVPISSNIVYLIIAGAVIGITTLNRQAKNVAVKL